MDLNFNSFPLKYLLGVSLVSLFWTQWFQLYFRSASRTKLLGVLLKLVWLISVCTWGYILLGLSLEKPKAHSNGCQTTFLLVYIKVSELLIKGTGEVIMEERVKHNIQLMKMWILYQKWKRNQKPKFNILCLYLQFSAFLITRMVHTASTDLWIGLNAISQEGFFWTDGKKRQYTNWGYSVSSFNLIQV